jgi:hypothetical protein
MVPALELLGKYASTFREMINSKVWGSRKSIRQTLKLNDENDWNFLTAAMDIIGDASAAISHVNRFGLAGPTKYDDLGEKYLRLYGLLGATYSQQQAILEIFRIMNVPNLKATKKPFDVLEIRTLRHKISAHGTDYRNAASGEKEAYVPLRVGLGDKDVTAVRHAAFVHHDKVNLTNAIEAHVKLMIDVMDVIIEKTIKTLFKDHPKKRVDFTAKLADLRIEKAGGLVFRTKGGPNFVVTFVGPSDSRLGRMSKRRTARRGAP